MQQQHRGLPGARRRGLARLLGACGPRPAPPRSGAALGRGSELLSTPSCCCCSCVWGQEDQVTYLRGEALLFLGCPPPSLPSCLCWMKGRPAALMRAEGGGLQLQTDGNLISSPWTRAAGRGRREEDAEAGSGAVRIGWESAAASFCGSPIIFVATTQLPIDFLMYEKLVFIGSS